MSLLQSDRRIEHRSEGLQQSYHGDVVVAPEGRELEQRALLVGQQRGLTDLIIEDQQPMPRTDATILHLLLDLIQLL